MPAAEASEFDYTEALRLEDAADRVLGVAVCTPDLQVLGIVGNIHLSKAMSVQELREAIMECSDIPPGFDMHQDRACRKC